VSNTSRLHSERRVYLVRVSLLLAMVLQLSLSTPLRSQSSTYGLEWPGDGAVRRMLYWHNPFPIYDATYVFKVFPRKKTSGSSRYYTTFFWGNDGRFDWQGGNPNTYYGAHPYPVPPPTGPGQWEISVDANDFVTGSEVQWDRWYTQAFRAWRESSSITHHEFYWDWPDTSKVIRQTVVDSSWANSNPPTPAIVMGQAPNFNGASWGGYPGWEEFNGIIRGIQIYSGLLSMADLQAEINAPQSTTAGQNLIWYLNTDPRPGDVTDKKGTGTPHDASWAGTTALEWTDQSSSPPPDTTPPTITLTAPAPGSSVLGSVTVSANASDNVGVAGVQFKLDGANLGTEDTSNPYSTSWNTTTVSNGSHTLTAVARDTAGNRATSAQVMVNVNNAAPPDTTPPTITNISASNISSTGATITWTTNEPADSQVEYGTTTSYGQTSPIDGTLATTHSINLSGASAATTYHLRVKSRDAAGNLATSGDSVFTTTAIQPAGISANINFQPAGPAAYPGYLVDSGSLYGVRGNGYSYGWNVVTDPRVRNSVLSPDQRYDTFVHMGNAVWEIAVPNGDYTVHVVVGDPDFADVVSKLTVEGLLAINGNTSNSNRWLEATVTVSVNDGRLTVGNLAGSYNKICYITITAPSGPTPDTTPPSISGVTASGVNSATATITWTTNEASDSQVQYGTTMSYGNSTPLDSSMVTSHSQMVSGLTAGTTYHFRVKSKDAAGNLATSGDFVFTTTATQPAGISVNINFQPAGAAYPGYLVDSGLLYGVRGNGYSYGWNAVTSPRVRNSALSPDARYDTFTHMENAVWEIALPNGSYTVHVVVGDPDWADVVSKLTVEGVLAINGNTSNSNRWLEATLTVSVNDGRLTIGNLAGSYNKICYIDISAP